MENNNRELNLGESSIIIAEFSSNDIIVTLNPPTPLATSIPHCEFYRSPLNSISSNVSIICRICHEYENNEDLITPCECSGSMALVHQNCLTKWLFVSGRNFCEVCGKEFVLPNQERSSHYEVRGQCLVSPSWAIVFLFLLSLGISFFFCRQMTDSNFEFWTAITLVLINIMACISVCFHAYYSAR